MIEIENELRRQIEDGENYEEWQNAASSLIRMRDSEMFHVFRAQIYQPFRQMNDISKILQNAKERIGDDMGIQADDYSWDALSYKIPFTAAECFFQKYPQTTQIINS